MEDLLQQISGGRSAAQAARERFDKYINDTGCEVVKDTELVDISTVFEGYFSGEAPFGAGKKKSEFPDALALHALEGTAADRDIGMLVVSKDGDWREFCEQSERLYLVSGIEKALDLVNNAESEQRAAIVSWIMKDGEGHPEIRQQIEHSIEQIEFTADGHAPAGALEASAWSGTLKSVEWPDHADIDIIDTETLDGGDTLQVTASLPLLLVVQVPVELSFSVWDSVDKETLGIGGRTIEIDEKLAVRMIITLSIRDRGSEDVELICDDSELDIQYHEIELGEVDVFEPEDRWHDSQD